MIIFSRSNQ